MQERHDIAALLGAMRDRDVPFNPVVDSDSVAHAEANRLARQMLLRQREALNHYQAMPSGQEAHECRAPWRIVDGSNRSGKTLWGAIEVARAATGRDPYNKYPARNGRALIVGKDGDHLADPLYRKLFDPGAFILIPDLETRLWRNLRVSAEDPTTLDPQDLERKAEWRPAPPLIPSRFITDIAWDDRKRRVPRIIRLTTGWELFFRSSMGDPPQGIMLDLAWLDEEVENFNFYPEICARLVDRNGVGFWTATPQAATPQLWKLRQRADEGDPLVRGFTLLVKDNPYLPPDAKQQLYDSLSEEEREARWYGRYALKGGLVYRMYSPMGVHGCEPFQIPSDWTRYVVVDPGRQHCGTLFAAVDPDEKHVWIHDGFDLRNGDAQGWAAAVAERQGRIRFEAMIIDGSMGTQHGSGQDRCVAELYWDALIAAGVKPRLQGGLSGFFAGTRDVAAREETLLNWLGVRGSGIFSGTSKLKVFRGLLPELDSQVHMAHYKAGKRAKIREDLLVCLEYLSHFNPYYQETEATTNSDVDPVWEAFQRRKAKRGNR